jgi:YidC/Oxa1 family membrane protein insertase
VATTPFVSMSSRGRIRTSRARWIALGLFVALVALAVVACGTAAAADPTAAPSVGAAASASPGASASVTPAPTAEPNPIAPTHLAADPGSIIGFLFTPLFSIFFLVLAGVYSLTGNVGIAIVVLTLLIRAVSIPLFRRQTVSQRRMQAIQPELKELTKELNRRHKGDKTAIYQATQAFYRERGVSPTAGCLPMILQMGLIWPMYQVISGGLTNFNPSAYFSVFTVKVIPLTCPNPDHIVNGVLNKALPCINTEVLGINVGQPNILFTVLGFGIGGLALVAALLQLFQSRMMMPPSPAEADPSSSTQRQMMYMMPLMTLLFSGFPAGIFIYWIVTTLFSIVQQYLIIGWGSMFPLFGWTPGFATDHTPRFPVTMPTPPITGKSVAETRRKPDDRWASAASTVRPNTHRRAGRRGRRR